MLCGMTQNAVLKNVWTWHVDGLKINVNVDQESSKSYDNKVSWLSHMQVGSFGPCDVPWGTSQVKMQGPW